MTKPDANPDPETAGAGAPASTDLTEVRALVFDVFGTVVDWHGSVLREGLALQARTGLAADWSALALAWRDGYWPAMAEVNAGGTGWASIDVIHRRILDGLLPRFGLDAMPEAERAHFNRLWHRLAPWPDTVPGLTRLKSRYTIASLSNGNMALLVNLAKSAGLPWDAVFSAELFRRYKPDPETYLGAARLLGLAPHQLMMVAAHPDDLAAAQRQGLKTAYIPRPDEYGPRGAMQPCDPSTFTLTAPSLQALAQRLGA